MADYYELLDVSRDASAAEIKQAYRKLAKKHHPDTNQGSEEAVQRFKQIHEAYETLRSEASRQAYDDRLRQKDSSGGRTEERGNPRSAGSGQGTAKTGAYTPPDAASMAAEFEKFFGFNPKTKQGTHGNNGKKQEGPLDADDMFGRFFGFRK
ncbi:DnaJ domain-containing protein [Paenibacillus terreus]|uniref:DnaJ domain-containing protein n=1 Tax=Paenibacillus terreus TaxID=1387834 RepID=A0ABV5B1H2_9BACL